MTRSSIEWYRTRVWLHARKEKKKKKAKLNNLDNASHFKVLLWIVWEPAAAKTKHAQINVTGAKVIRLPDIIAFQLEDVKCIRMW